MSKQTPTRLVKVRSGEEFRGRPYGKRNRAGPLASTGHRIGRSARNVADRAGGKSTLLRAHGSVPKETCCDDNMEYDNTQLLGQANKKKSNAPIQEHARREAAPPASQTKQEH